ncbi:unnamed protein product [Prorocentrum cordatum]|uniref:TLC domain-containing protein n=1 Tax=Prorocentrum cordatum TaxID=2364126 RepID=A0ABN9X0V1_9DINO|nr:unnamed protein product [Polarella glacialis]
MAPPATDGAAALLAEGLAWTALWILLFYILSATYPRWSRGVPASSKEHENSKYWAARNLLGAIHAVLVSVLSVPAMVELMFAADAEVVRFSYSVHLATCKAPEEIAQWNTVGEAIALAGLMFTTFTLADCVVSPMHGLIGWDMGVHHVAFIFAGAVIRGHCMLPFNASALISMEVSTPFLNYLVHNQHRGDAYKTRVDAAGVIFFVTFLVFRIGLNTYATVVLWIAHFGGVQMSAHMPAWQQWVMLLAVSAGAAMQLFWFPHVTRKVRSRLVVLGGRPAVGGDRLLETAV